MRRLLPLFALLLLVAITPAHAQFEKPFVMPVAAPPSPGTWLLGQPYGNTTGAYLRGDAWYSAGQRLHFGIDLSMPCGTPLVAIGDGEVVGVSDLSFGSAPHNLLIRHDAGYVSLYGHLLERPNLAPGMRVSQGEQVALSGDPDLTCVSRPHLHLEIRSLNYLTTYNPVALINADWHSLALIGQFRYPMFQQDLDNARRWMSQDNQPEVNFGGQALNNYAATFPTLDMIGAPPSPLYTLPSQADAQLRVPTADSWSVRRVGFDGCCANAWWSSDGSLLYMIDGADGARAMVYEWDVATGAPTGNVTAAPPPLRSADGTHTIAMQQTVAIITRVADGAQFSVETGGAVPVLNLDNTALLWTQSSEVALPGEPAPRTAVWTRALDGGEARLLADATGLSAQWLDSGRVLVSQRSDQTTNLFVVDAATAEAYGLGAWTFLRGLSVAPGGGRLMFYLAYQADSAANGVYVIDTQSGAAAQRLAWFGGWRWRDGESVYYVPFTSPPAPLSVYREGESAYHQLRWYHIPTGEDVALTDPAVTPFVISDGDWSVSPDGARIAFWNALDKTTWVLEAAG
jgi:hypothetical protein